MPFCRRRRFELQEIDAGIWKLMWCFRLSLWRLSTLYHCQKATMGGGRSRDEPVEHTEACHYPLLSMNVSTRGKLYRKRDFRVVRAMDCKTSPAITISSSSQIWNRIWLSWQSFDWSLSYTGFSRRWWRQVVELASVYCPGISMSSNFPCWNSVR